MWKEPEVISRTRKFFKIRVHSRLGLGGIYPCPTFFFLNLTFCSIEYCLEFAAWNLWSFFMPATRMKPFWIGGAVFGTLFAVLFSMRIDLWETLLLRPHSASLLSPASIDEKETWMKVLQNGRKIGFSHSKLKKEERGYQLKEVLTLRVSAMGMVQEVVMETAARFQSDLALVSFDARIRSGRFGFSAQGAVSGGVLTVGTQADGRAHTTTLKVERPIYLLSGLMQSAAASVEAPGETETFEVFDPATLSSTPVGVKLIGRESVLANGTWHRAKKISLTFRGATQFAWFGEDGIVLKESGLLGMTLERTSREDALSGSSLQPGEDLTKEASIPSNVEIENPVLLERLAVKIEGVDLAPHAVGGGRQTFVDGLLSVRKEKIRAAAGSREGVDPQWLAPDPFIQSDHPEIVSLAGEITKASPSALSKAIKLVSWVNEHIEKRPVLSVPDAVSTLQNRVGDCNEHAVLLAALARAAGIPAKIEAGLTYLNGRFYYHAWNLLYLGNWITADATLGQIPADVTHLRLTGGDRRLPTDLLGVIGRLQLTVVELEP